MLEIRTYLACDLCCAPRREAAQIRGSFNPPPIGCAHNLGSDNSTFEVLPGIHKTEDTHLVGERTRGSTTPEEDRYNRGYERTSEALNRGAASVVR